MGTAVIVVTPPLNSWWQRLLLSVVCLLGAAACAIGVYLWRWWPEQWQAGLVFSQKGAGAHRIPDNEIDCSVLATRILLSLQDS